MLARISLLRRHDRCDRRMRAPSNFGGDADLHHRREQAQSRSAGPHRPSERYSHVRANMPGGRSSDTATVEPSAAAVPLAISSGGHCATCAVPAPPRTVGRSLAPADGARCPICSMLPWQTLHPIQAVQGIDQAAALIRRQVNLRSVSRDDDLRSLAHAGQEHLHLRHRSVLRLHPG